MLYTFTGGNDGSYPDFAPFAVDSKGNLYGTTASGGTFNYGTVFELPASGDKTVLYNFLGAPGDAQLPNGPLVRDSKGNLFGATSLGGSYGDGTVFELKPKAKTASCPSGSNTGTGYCETVLYSFAGGTADSALPSYLADYSGTLYGTAYYGEYGNGIVFALEPAPTGGVCPTGTNQGNGWCETVLYAFTGGNDGATPLGGVILHNTNLYGTTYYGGPYGFGWNGLGTVFELSPAPAGGVCTTGNQGNGWCETVIYAFSGVDGYDPYHVGLVAVGANLFGTTEWGGGSGYGTVFELSPKPLTGCKKGTNPGNGWCETVLYGFTGGADGNQPFATLVRDKAGHLWGTTAYGGTSGNGTVFELSKLLSGAVCTGAKGSNGWCETVPHSFAGGTADGSQPNASLVLNKLNGYLYGTAEFGGSTNCSSGSEEGCGVVYQIKP